MDSKKIIHIDYGSNGTAGLYLAQILNAYSGPIPIEAYVHSKFPHISSHRRIYRIFDRFSNFFPGENLKKIVKAIDLYLIFLYLIFIIRRASSKHNLYIFVQFFQSFHAYKFFFNWIKKYCTLVVTVHDAVELKHNYPSVIMSARDDIISHAHYILVHNDESVDKLNYLKKPILKIPFPLMLDDNIGKSINLPLSDKVKFLFIGHIRPEKGIDELIAAWRKLPLNIISNACLTIAGTYNSDLNLNFENLKNCTLLFEYLDDEKFVQLINSSHYVVLPYRGGTNSGVLSMSSALGRPCITTKIPIFTESAFFEELLSFEFYSELDKLISQLVINHSEKYDIYLERNNMRLIQSQSLFQTKIKDLYEKIIYN
jgi:glycosyltransferase involved in cell wall biosynthesis